MILPLRTGCDSPRPLLAPGEPKDSPVGRIDGVPGTRLTMSPHTLPPPCPCSAVSGPWSSPLHWPDAPHLSRLAQRPLCSWRPLSALILIGGQAPPLSTVIQLFVCPLLRLLCFQCLTLQLCGRQSPFLAPDFLATYSQGLAHSGYARGHWGSLPWEGLHLHKLILSLSSQLAPPPPPPSPQPLEEPSCLL